VLDLLRSTPRGTRRSVRRGALLGAVVLGLATSATVFLGRSESSTDAVGGRSAARGGALANIWIDATTSDNACIRSAARVAYNSTRACSTFVSACGRAQGRDIVHFADGVYNGETVLRSHCDPASRVTFAVTNGSNATFQGPWKFGDQATRQAGPRKITIRNWRFRRNVSGSDRIDWHEVRDFTASKLVVQSWDISATSLDPPDWNMVIRDSDFGGCDGDGAKGLYADRCITRITGGAGITLRNNRWWGYPAPGSNCTINVNCPRGVALAFIFPEGKVRNVVIERSRFRGNKVADIRFQPRSAGVLENVTLRNNWFGNTGFDIDHRHDGGRIDRMTIVGNSMVSGWNAAGGMPPNTLVARNIFTRGGSNCYPSEVTWRHNIAVSFSEFTGRYICHATEVLWEASNGGSIFGYSLRPGRLIRDTPEAAVVRRLFAEAARGRSAAQIARTLRRRRAPTPVGNAWTPATVRRILRDRRYLGGMYGADGAHRALVARRVWRAAQRGSRP
jgi:hypothetical protein